MPFWTLAGLRHVDAGSCNGCESELQALDNPRYNLHRLGVFFTASPHAAGVLLVTGPVTHALEGPLRAAYQAMPEPRWVMVIGPLPGGTAFALDGNAGWLLGFGFAAAVPVCLAGPAGTAPRGWCFGAALAMLGA